MGDSFAERGSLKFTQLLSRGSIVRGTDKSQTGANELGYKQFQRAPFGELLQSHPRVTFFSAVSDEGIPQAWSTLGALMSVRQRVCPSEQTRSKQGAQASAGW